eukprot:TRINITY_DN3811_c0_g4_i1.p1 TRINITY_DN3811_c0_g4~~TRINITY_DN3811_c0_g4_i1.p1  ORF type:complete len:1196 (+),score=309.37 TRINITY_DN3811_c0_g4_i1:66-3653(+)
MTPSPTPPDAGGGAAKEGSFLLLEELTSQGAPSSTTSPQHAPETGAALLKRVDSIVSEVTDDGRGWSPRAGSHPAALDATETARSAARQRLENNLRRQEQWRLKSQEEAFVEGDAEPGVRPGSAVAVSEKAEVGDDFPTGAAAARRTRLLPLNAVFLVAAALSLAASMAGGLVMYFEAVKSLEASVEETSEKDVRAVADEIERISMLPLRIGEQMMRSLYHDDGSALGGGTDYAAWGAVIGRASSASLSAFPETYCSGVVLVPQDDVAAAETLYLTMWRDPLKDGTEKLVFGRRIPNADPEGTNYTLPIENYIFNDTTGALGDPVDVWDGKWYLSLLAGYTPGEPLAGWGAGPAQHPPPFPTYGRKRRLQEFWYSQDSTPYAYSGWDTLYAPPPPPHPWSRYKAVVSVQLYAIARFGRALERHAKKHADTEILLFDSSTTDVFAATTGERLIEADCSEKVFVGHAPECSTNVSALGELLHGAWAAARGKGEFFGKASLHSGEHFMRQQRLYGTCWILWVRPVSVVQDKVNDALVLLVVFGALVLLVDTAIAAAEVVFLVLPIKRLGVTINALGAMRTEEALRRIADERSRPVMITELHALLAGTHSAASALARFKSFLPDASLQSFSRAPRRTAPTGFVSIAFSDIVGSTALWENAPDDVGHVIDLHFKALRSALHACNGYEVKSLGDGLMVAFDSTQDAYEYGLDAHVALLGQPWPEFLDDFPMSQREVEHGDTVFAGLRVRIGIHCGEVAVDKNPLTGRTDYRSRAVNKAARIEAHALAGMTAFSEDFKGRITASQPVHRLGPRTLKGIGEATLYYSVPKALARREGRFRLMAATGSTGREDQQNPLRVWGRDLSESPSTPPRLPLSNSGSLHGMAQSSLMLRQASELSMKLEVGAVVVLSLTKVQEQLDVDASPEALFPVLNGFLQRALDFGNLTDGKVENVFDSVVVLSWGLSSHVSEPDRNCLRFVGSIHTHAADAVTTGAVVGPFLHGCVGTKIRRYHSIVGRGYQYAHRLPSLCAAYQQPSLMIIARGVPIQYAGCCMPVDVVKADGGYGPFVVLETPIAERCNAIGFKWEAMASNTNRSDAYDDPVVLFRGALVEAAARGEPLPPRLHIPGLPASMRALQKTVAARGAVVIADGELHAKHGQHRVARTSSSIQLHGFEVPQVFSGTASPNASPEPSAEPLEMSVVSA